MINYENLGLNIYDNFISDEEHSILMNEIIGEIRKTDIPGRYISRNRVLRYGDQSMCENNYISNDLPPIIDKIALKLVKDNLLKYKPDTININEYLKDDYIHPHIDRKASGPVVTILSLQSPATMVFTDGKVTFEQILYPKMLIQMRDIIRWRWHHSILPVEDTRYSIVFRNKFEA